MGNSALAIKEGSYGVLMIDVSDPPEVQKAKTKDALKIIYAIYPQMRMHIFTSFRSESEKETAFTLDTGNRYSSIARVISTFDFVDYLFCNTCGDEIDHLYRFVRAIAKNAGLTIIPMKDLRDQLEEGDK